MNTKIFAVVIIMLSSVAINGQQSFDMLRSYIAYKTNTPIKIDGKADEQAWQRAEFSQNFIDIEGDKSPGYKTQMKMLWDDQYLYIYAKMEEPHVWATLKQKDTVIFYNNDFEVFIDPNNDTHNYYELEFNALNTLWDLLITKPYRAPGNQIAVDWNISDYKSAIHVDGTLNNSKDIDQGWHIEIALAWSSFRTSYYQNNTPSNEFWRINFSRVNWDFELTDGRYSRKKDANGKFLHEHNWVWSPTGVINMHEPEMWGYVFFSTEQPGSNATFDIPIDEQVKFTLYNLYKKQLAFKKKHGKIALSITKLGQPNIKVNGKRLVYRIENHLSGWNIQTQSPFTNKTYVIKEDGLILTK